MTKIYLAGPLFTIAERDFNLALARFLESRGFEVWLPQQHEPRRRTARGIFRMCAAALDEADLVVACMDGPDPDSGTAWECGFAYAKGMPVIGYRSDFRIAGDAVGRPYNLMLTESATVRFELAAGATSAQFHRRLLAKIRKALRGARIKQRDTR